MRVSSAEDHLPPPNSICGTNSIQQDQRPIVETAYLWVRGDVSTGGQGPAVVFAGSHPHAHELQLKTQFTVVLYGIKS